MERIQRIRRVSLRWSLLPLTLVILTEVAAVQQPPEREARTVSPPSISEITGEKPAKDHRYRIGPGDVLDVRVFNRPQLSRDSVRVDESGTIVMPLIGEVPAACKTEKELAGVVRHLYREYQNDPQVDVFVKEYHSQTVAVLGAVKSPGRFQLRRSVRILEMLSFVGGPDARAGRTVQVIRDPSLNQLCSGNTFDPGSGAENGSDDNVKSLELAQIMKGNPESNLYVSPGDIITILEADQVYIVGNVLRPSALPLNDLLTVSRAIAMVGGTMPDTKSDRVRIVRQLPNGGKSELLVDLKAIDKKSAEDVVLQPNDVVDVPTSEGKRFMRSLLGVIAPSVGGLPVRVIH